VAWNVQSGAGGPLGNPLCEFALLHIEASLFSKLSYFVDRAEPFSEPPGRPFSMVVANR